MSANAKILYEQALLSEKQGDYAAAITQLTKVIALQKAHYQARNKLGNLLIAQGDIDLAIQQFQSSVDYQPQSASLRNNLGCALAMKGSLLAAEQQFKHAVGCDPHDRVSYNNLCNLYRNQGRLAEAVSQFSAYVNAYPQAYAAKCILATVLMAGNQLDKAEACLQVAIRLAPEQFEAHDLYAYTLHLNGKTKVAIHSYLNALKIQPNNVDVLRELSRLYMVQAAYAQAAAHLQTLLTLNADDSSANIDYGFVMARVGDTQRMQWLQQLDENTVYEQASQAQALALDLTQSSPLSEAGGREIAHNILQEFDAGELYPQAWWQHRLARFGGKQHAFDRVLRGVFTLVYAWSIPTQEAVSKISAFASGARLYSYGAGAGYWEYLLCKHFRDDVVSTDILLANRFVEMEKLELSQADVESGDVIFIGWVRTVERIGDEVIRLLKCMVSGQKLVIIGDQPTAQGIPRTCGTKALFAYLAQSFLLQERIALPNFSYLHDAVSLFVKK